MRKSCLIGLLVLVLVIPILVYAHQPRIVPDGLTVIENPEVSQAFYGTLKGNPHYYQITSEEAFTLYVSILVPDLEGIGKDVSVTVTSEQDSEVLASLDGLGYEWTALYEPFAGDSYYKGPEAKTVLGAGTYIIEVSSIDNEGKYVLVVGEKEEFSLNEILHTIRTLPSLKRDFFEKSPLTAFFNLFGLFLVISLLLIVIIILVLRRFIRKRRTPTQPRN